MCLAIPAKVISVNGTTALVTIEDVEYTASLLLLDDVNPGDYVMLHAGFAIQKVDAEEAAETLQLLQDEVNGRPGQTTG
jgi:hydrogenase expression/formation protein HypC